MRGSTCCHRTRAFLCVGPCVQTGHRHALMTRKILCTRFQCPSKYHSWLRTCGALTHTLSTDVDVSLKDFHPYYPRHSCPFCFDTLSRIRLVIPLLHFERKTIFFSEKQKSNQIFCVTLIHYDRDRGGNRSTHYPGNWIVSVCVRTEHPVQPLLCLSISKRYQLSSTDPPVSTVGW